MKCLICNLSEAWVFFRWEKAIVYQQVLVPSKEQAYQCSRGNIELAFCPHCGFIWNTLFEPSLLQYTSSYEASQMFSSTFRKYVEDVAKSLIRRYNLRRKEIIEIGCGDGAFLKLLCELGDNRGAGFDPASRTATEMAGKVIFIPDYYSKRYVHYQGDFICCRHVLEHIQNPVEFLLDLKRLTESRRPIFFFEVPNVIWSLRQLAFWDIYYEHCSYFSTASCIFLFTICGLAVLKIGEGFGGQYVWIEASPPERKRYSFEEPFSEQVQELVNVVEAFTTRFPKKINSLKEDLDEMTCHSRVVIWGAGAKAVALLNILDIRQIEFVVDINPKKQGNYVPGTGQRIISPDFLQKYKPDRILVMNPAYFEEVRLMVESLKIKADVQIL